MRFYLVLKKFMITKNLVVKIENLVVNHESRLVQSNPKSQVFQTLNHSSVS